MSEELIGIIGGTGLGEALARRLADVKMHQVDTPFGKPSGAIMVGHNGRKTVAFINRHGEGHKFSPSDVPFAANIFALKKLGVHTLIAGAAVGSLRDEIRPKELVIVDQFIDKTFRRQNSFFNSVAAVHCEMAQPVCGRLRKKLLKASEDIDVKTHQKATYLCMEGPQFSTRAESLMHRAWGADLIGMTAMPEAKLAREAQMCYAVVALVSDYDCWRPREAAKNKQTLLKEITGNLQEATDNAVRIVEALLRKSDELANKDCPCRKSLELAVWTTQEQFGREDRERLRVLFE